MATYSNGAKNAALDGLATYGNFISLHTSSPSTTGANEVSGTGYARVSATWAASSGGSKATAQVSVTVPAGVTISHYGVWSALTSGNFSFGDALPASEVFGSQGTYQITVTATMP
jgi:hypothetical protein